MSLKAGLLLVCALVGAALAVPLEEGQDAHLDQWVVSVPEGVDRAKRLSEEHDLQFLGEVIPESNLFHFSVKENHRRKRSVVENVHQILSDHPGINFRTVLIYILKPRILEKLKLC